MTIPREVGIKNANFWDQKSEPEFWVLDENFRTRPQTSCRDWVKFPNSNSDLAGVKTPKFCSNNTRRFVFMYKKTLVTV